MQKTAAETMMMIKNRIQYEHSTTSWYCNNLWKYADSNHKKTEIIKNINNKI